MTASVTVTRPDGTAKVRTFANRREAAKYGVAYYLCDNGYATPREASAAASQYQDHGRAELHGFTFRETTTPDQED